MQSHACQFNVGLTVTSQCLFCWFCCTPRVFSGSTNQNETGHIPKAPLFAVSSGLYCHKLVGGATYYWIALDSSLFYLHLSFPYLITFSQSTAYFIAIRKEFFPKFYIIFVISLGIYLIKLTDFGDQVYEFNYKPMESSPTNRLKIIIMKLVHHTRNVSSSYAEVKKNYQKPSTKKASFQKPAQILLNLQWG